MIRDTVSRLWDRALNLIFPPKCVSCDALLDFRSTEALCPICRVKYESEKGFLCPDCQKPHSKCECRTKVLEKTVAKELHLVEYSKEESVSRDMILFAKDCHYEYLYRLLSWELAELLKVSLDTPERYLVTFVPRSRRKEAEHGVDQAREMAKRIAKALSADFACCLKHRYTAEQKGLSLSERKKNTAASYSLIEKKASCFEGRSVILYDDVVTTGATLAACAKLLKKAGAKEVVVLTYGKTYRHETKEKTPILKSKGVGYGKRNE